MKQRAWVVLLGAMAAPALSAEAAAEPGRFYRTAWAGTRGNRFRVNSPDTRTGPFKDRWEARQTGVMKITVDEDLSQVMGAALHLELWGGHPGVANKRFTLNGASEYALPEVGAARHNCVYSYPAVLLKPEELKRGENVFAFTCDKGSAFWGHYLIRAARVQMELKRAHPGLMAAGLADFGVAVVARPAKAGGEAVALSLDLPAGAAKRIAAVEYWGRYSGYDENGDGKGRGLHGFRKDCKPVGNIATVTSPPFAATWDLAMVPRTPRLGVGAIVRFRDRPDLLYATNSAEVAFPKRTSRRVTLHLSKDLPRPFWSRAGRVRTCTIELDADPARIERAELHVLIWDGGKGKTREPFTLNGHALPVAGQGRHDVLYRVLPLDPQHLRRGANKVRVLSDTQHHGIEVLLPGPGIMVRRRE